MWKYQHWGGKAILAFSGAILGRYSTLDTIVEATGLIQEKQLGQINEPARSWLPQMWLTWKKRPDMEIRLDKILKWHFKWACALDDSTPDLGKVVKQGAPSEPVLVYLRLDCPTVQCAVTYIQGTVYCE